MVRTPAYSHTISHHHPIVAFTDVRVPAGNLVGAEGDGMAFAYEWFRFERLMVAARCLGAADRLTEAIIHPFRSRILKDPQSGKLEARQAYMTPNWPRS